MLNICLLIIFISNYNDYYNFVDLVINHTDTIKTLRIFQDKIGRVIVTLTRAILEGEFQDTFHIDGAKSGKLQLNLKWVPQNKLRESM
jgi:hypothetical protein